MAVTETIAIETLSIPSRLKGVNTVQQLASLERTWQGKLVADLQKWACSLLIQVRVVYSRNLDGGQTYLSM